MPQEKLDLLELAAGQMAQSRARAPQVVWSEFLDTGTCRRRPDDIPEPFGDIPSPQIRPALLMARNTGPSVMAAAAVHASTADLTHRGIGTVRT